MYYTMRLRFTCLPVQVQHIPTPEGGLARSSHSSTSMKTRRQNSAGLVWLQNSRGQRAPRELFAWNRILLRVALSRKQRELVPKWLRPIRSLEAQSLHRALAGEQHAVWQEDSQIRRAGACCAAVCIE